ncbi:hypothetical protein Zmor_011299 [Zophobas morio]|uniref:CCHC-type domain-containing protein n=1 Tax=Zophobas morio TaxID=2755281 RepID=A0AA38IPW9_9CUCU|nr:hypothetical protein Zmor_011299 [Zophobas morio]
MECHRCGRQGHLKGDCRRQGHLKGDCRARLPAPRRSTQRRSHRDVKGASTLGNGFTGENKAASEVKIRSFTRSSGSTVLGKIMGEAEVEICVGQLKIRHGR